MKKISELNYKLESGKQVNITIVRVYGNEQVAKDCDGINTRPKYLFGYQRCRRVHTLRG